MNRKGTSNLTERIASMQNLELADNNARRHKHNIGITIHDKHRESDLQKIRRDLLECTYQTSQYSTFKVYEPKEREIYRLPYYPDRITHWAILLVLEPIWVKKMISSTYSCLKGRGIHKCAEDVKKALRSDKQGTKYCLKLDIKKYYPSIDHDVLKRIVRSTIKDKRLLKNLDNIIDSTTGIPIGNYLSQFFANLYLSSLDHIIKEEYKVKYYFRYMDDMILLSDSKEKLHKLRILIEDRLNKQFNVRLKSNYQVFPVDIRGIDFVGYRMFHRYTLLRISIKRRILKACMRYKNNLITKESFLKTIFSYYGWLKHCDSKHLLQKIYDITNIHLSNWNGIKMRLKDFYKKLSYFIRPFILEVIRHKKYFEIHFVYKNKSYVTISKSSLLYNFLYGNNFTILNYYFAN